MELIVEYSAYTSLNFNLPAGKTADDIEDVRIKYLQLQIWFKDGTTYEETIDPPEVDTKWPNYIEINDNDGNPVYNQ